MPVPETAQGAGTGHPAPAPRAAAILFLGVAETEAIWLTDTVAAAPHPCVHQRSGGNRGQELGAAGADGRG